MSKISKIIVIFIIIMFSISQVGYALELEENDNKQNEDKETNIEDLNIKPKVLNENTIEEGIYEIETGVSAKKVVEVRDASQYSGGNVQIFAKNNAKCQKVNVKYVGSGYYTLQFLHSGMYLDVANAEIANGTNVWQCRENGSDAQKWIIKETEDGYYNIISKCSNTYLTVKDGKTGNCTNIEINEYKEDASQKFKFIKEEQMTGTKTIEEGTYEIETGVNVEKVVEVRDASKYSGGNVQIFAKNNARCQKVNVKYVGNGYYTLQFKHSGMYLDVANAETTNGTNVWQCRENGSDAQKWIIKETEDGYYNIISKCSNTYLTVKDGKTGNCTNIEINAYKEDASQKFKFIKEEQIAGTKTIEQGIYEIETGVNEEKVVEVRDASKYSGGNVQIFAKNNARCQKVNVKYVGNGYYTLQFRHSGMYLDVANAETTNGTNVWQCRENGSDAQKWIIKETEDGYYKIISKCSNTYLTVKDGKTGNCTNIEISTDKEDASQKFKFIKTTDKIFEEAGYYGSSGLKVKGDYRGDNLKYYKIGNGSNVFFATFAVHGFEDLWSNDGQELTKVAEAFRNRLISMQDVELLNKWTIYIFPSVNPDGEYYGSTNNGPGRTSLYSVAPYNKGIDINRCWSTGYTKSTVNRYYNGTEPFQAYEAQALRDFLLSHRATNGQTILVDLHGWLNETIGDNEIGGFYRQQFGISKHIGTYGNGYLVNWARSNLGYNGIAARSCLVEMPEESNPNQIWEYVENYINASINMLRTII